MYPVFVFIVSVLAGSVAAIAGFGIGSLLTPLFAWQVGVKLAVAAVAVPHFCGTALRLWMLRGAVDRRVLLSFGLSSATGGLAGALLHSAAGNRALAVVFGALLVFAGLTGLTGLAERMRFGKRMGWVAGAFSGLLGGLVGNQGGIRSAAMLGFDLSRDAFVATATATALIVDVARLPVYLATQGAAIATLWPALAIATAGVIFGTLMGRRALEKIPERVFRRIVGAIILALGVYMLITAL
jgi:uncharacterized protein